MSIPNSDQQELANRSTRYNGIRTTNWGIIVNNRRIHRSPTPDAEENRLPPPLRNLSQSHTSVSESQSSTTPASTITPLDSISQAPQRIPDILNKVWEPKDRSGEERALHSNVYDWYISISLGYEWTHKKTGKAKININRECKWCKSEGKFWDSDECNCRILC